MRALVDMTDIQVAALDNLAKQQRASRAALIRAAIDDYLERHQTQQVADSFGLWSNPTDGLVYQEKLRGEW